MNAFMPSEIARLVLGYLKEINCNNTWNAFLDECSHLKEYRECLTSGFQYPTNMCGKSLKTVLNEYYGLKLVNVTNVHIEQPNRLNSVIGRSLNTSGNEIERPRCQNAFSANNFHDKSFQISNTEFEEHLKSPRRKHLSPKKKNNLRSTPKHSNISTVEEEDGYQSEESVDISVLLEQLMNSRALHEKIAENINKAVSTTSQPSTSSHEDNLFSVEKELTIKEIVDRTQSDPVFEEFLNSFFDNIKHDSGSLDVTQTQIQTEDNNHNNNNNNAIELTQCSTPLNHGLNDICSSVENNAEQLTPLPPHNETPYVDPSHEQIPISSTIVEVTSSETDGIDVAKQNSVSNKSKLNNVVNTKLAAEEIVTSIPSLPQSNSTPEPKPTFCFPSSSNHLILKTPYKNQHCLQVITISPGEIDWPTLSNLNLMLTSPYGNLLKQPEDRNEMITNIPVNNTNNDNNHCDVTQSGVENHTKITTTTSINAASPSQLLKAKNRLDCHVVRDLNFGSPTVYAKTTKQRDRSPGLTTLVNSAKNIVQIDHTKKGSHIRALTFKTPGKKNKTPENRKGKEVVKTSVPVLNSVQKDCSSARKRKLVTVNRNKLKRPKTDSSIRGLNDMDVEKFLNNLQYFELNENYND